MFFRLRFHTLRPYFGEKALFFQNKCNDRVYVHTGRTLQKDLVQRNKNEIKVGLDKPYPFMSKIQENKFQTIETFENPKKDQWEYQNSIVSVCLLVFFTYFAMLREEHSVDDMLYKPLYKTIPSLEVSNLHMKINILKKEGKDTTLYEERLKVLLDAKAPRTT